MCLRSLIFFRWTGSNSNPNNNDGQGRAGTDRSNVVMLTNQQYPEGTPGLAVEIGKKFGHWGTNYPQRVDNTSFFGFTRTDLKNLAILQSGEQFAYFYPALCSHQFSMCLFTEKL